jgi:hypothetical protein
MGCTATSLPHNAAARWSGEQRRSHLAILLWFCLVFATRLFSQDGVQIQSFNGGRSYPVVSGPDSVHGTVINGRTREPIAKALVYTPDNRYAMLTDDRGHFEFKFPPPEKTAPPVPTSGSDAEGMRKVQQWYARNARPGVFFARRPGFLPDPNGARVPDTGAERAELVITLEPEALIVGHVQLPGVDNTDRIQLQLYRQEFEEGHERWINAGGFTTWASGEFRFPELPAGTYKLFTVERLERDPAIFNPRDQLYGFPPVFFPNGSDFSAATPIRLTAGATFQANLTVTRREYYPVRIGVANPPATGYPSVEVYLRGQPGPGYSLSYDPAEQVVRGFLPDGGYTLKLFAHGEQGSSGTMNFTVRGGPVEGLVVSLHPNVSLSVNITREFASGGGTGDESNNEGDGTRGNVTIALSPAEQFGMMQTVMSQPTPGDSEGGLTLNNVIAGTYWMQISTNNCYPTSATWGGGDVLHRPLMVGEGGASTPIEVTLRNDGAEVSGKVQFPESASSQKSNEGPSIAQMAFIYFVPLDENAGQLRRTQVWQNGVFDERQIAPGTYRILAFDHLNAEIGPTNAELLRKYESKGVVVELSVGQTLRLPSPLTLVSEP